jgi:hypothetical protein
MLFTTLQFSKFSSSERHVWKLCSVTNINCELWRSFREADQSRFGPFNWYGSYGSLTSSGGVYILVVG